MKKLLLTMTLLSGTSLIAAPCSHNGQWNLGLAAGWGTTRTEIHEKFFNKGNLVQEYKAKVHGNGLTGGLTADYMMSKNKLIWGIGLGAYLDAYTAKDNSNKKNLHEPDLEADTNDSLKRNYTFEASMKVGHQLTPDVALYGKLGGLYSTFKRQHSANEINQTNKSTKGAWGGVIGAGIMKQYSPSVKVGLAYDFHLYQSLKVKTGPYHYTTNLYQDVTNMRPRYHQVYLTLSKAF